MSTVLIAPTASRLAVALDFLALAGCEGTPGGAARDVGLIRVRATDLRVVGTAESIAVVEDLPVLPNGTVWVLNSVEPFVVFAPTTRFGSTTSSATQLRGFTAEGLELDPVAVPPPFTEATPRQFARAAFDLAVAATADEMGVNYLVRGRIVKRGSSADGPARPTPPVDGT